jgi:hypothetical protein
MIVCQYKLCLLFFAAVVSTGALVSWVKGVPDSKVAGNLASMRSPYLAQMKRFHPIKSGNAYKKLLRKGSGQDRSTGVVIQGPDFPSHPVLLLATFYTPIL